MLKKTIGEILTANVISVSPQTPVLEALSVMSKKGISCLLIVCDKKPVGIFTERCLVHLLHQKHPLEKCKIEEVMSKPVLTVKSDLDIYQAHNILKVNKIRHLAVINSEDEIIGVVTQTDIIHSFGIEHFLTLNGIAGIITQHVGSVKKGELVQTVIDKMAEHSISCVVIEKDNMPVGILTERDILHLSCERNTTEDVKVEEVMSHPVQTISLEASAYEAITIMDQKNIRRLVVADEAGKIVGIITQTNLLKELKSGYIRYLEMLLDQRTHDIEEAHEQILKAERIATATQIASEIAHEIRNPLSILNTGLYFLKKKIDNKEEPHIQETLQRMHNAIQRANDFIEDFLNLFKPPILNLREIDIKEVIANSLEEIQPYLFSSIEIKKVLDEGIPLIQGDSDRLEQVFTNLFKNAAEAMSQGGVLTISLSSSSHPSYLEIAIKDTGMGIPKENAEKVFDPFFTTRRGKGTELGLSICKRIILAHTGMIEVESEAGKGTTILIRLPIKGDEIHLSPGSQKIGK